MFNDLTTGEIMKTFKIVAAIAIFGSTITPAFAATSMWCPPTSTRGGLSFYEQISAWFFGEAATGGNTTGVDDWEKHNV
jgi:hypothetical protein